MSANQGALQRYNNVAILLHWAIAACILFNLGLGFFMEGFAPPLKGTILALHFSAGITVLPLTLIRIIWRLTHKPPAFDPHMPGYEAAAAHLVHFLLYLGMILMPIIGWSIISAHPPRPGASGPLIWWSVHLPPLHAVQMLQPADYQKHMHDQFVLWHSIGGYTMVALLVLHVAGALKHQFVDRVPELQRMMFGRGRI